MANPKYEVLIERSAAKSLEKISKSEQPKLASAIKNLSQDPRPIGYKKLTGRDAYRIRVGNYRIIYEIHDKILRILVVDIGHRKDIYR